MCHRLIVATLVVALAAHVASAQTTTAVTTPPRADTVVRRLNLDAARVQPAQYAYRLLLTRDTTTSAIGDQQFAVTALDYAGTPALLLVRAGTQGVTTTSDSLVVRRDDLRPLHWIASQGVARVAAEFTNDSIYGAMTSPLGKQNVVLPNRGDLLVNAMAVDAVVAAAPLSATWRDSATMLVVDAGGATITPVALSVDGEERIAVPAGEFDCWIVSAEAERASERLWVTKQGQVVVRTEQILPDLSSAALTRVLVLTDSPALIPSSARLPH